MKMYSNPETQVVKVKMLQSLTASPQGGPSVGDNPAGDGSIEGNPMNI